MVDRLRPEVIVRHNTKSQSSRNGAKPSLIVLHTTEMHNRPGVEDLMALASWFDNPRAQASSHIGNDAARACSCPIERRDELSEAAGARRNRHRVRARRDRELLLGNDSDGPDARVTERRLHDVIELTAAPRIDRQRNGGGRRVRASRRQPGE